MTLVVSMLVLLEKVAMAGLWVSEDKDELEMVLSEVVVVAELSVLEELKDDKEALLLSVSASTTMSTSTVVQGFEGPDDQLLKLRMYLETCCFHQVEDTDTAKRVQRELSELCFPPTNMPFRVFFRPRLLAAPCSAEQCQRVAQDFLDAIKQHCTELIAEFGDKDWYIVILYSSEVAHMTAFGFAWMMNAYTCVRFRKAMFYIKIRIWLWVPAHMNDENTSSSWRL
ncbi:hypothetical protein CPB84DRAFT_1752667 [Gymnopilus junonius]|uniref:Uncharacterized protein n=1 Tax=Gymnopilus junonius TaxID=109634 RepID=A0A9P5N8Z1_GYMJU|nr:hypothetical protein CPB84DRAFT_1752667 [Gymnopilus junonius]